MPVLGLWPIRYKWVIGVIMEVNKGVYYRVYYRDLYRGPIIGFIIGVYIGVYIGSI
jgi:hypothetical protein